MTFFNGFQPENIIKIITRNMGFQPLIAVSRLLLYCDKSKYGFEGITDKAEMIKQYSMNLLFERTTIEEIMLAYVKEREKNDYTIN